MQTLLAVILLCNFRRSDSIGSDRERNVNQRHSRRSALASLLFGLNPNVPLRYLSVQKVADGSESSPLAPCSCRSNSGILCTLASDPATTALYFQDTSLLEASASVLKIESTDAGWLVILDATVFHPKGGGQPSDIGMIGGERVTEVFAQGRPGQDGVIFHVLDREPSFAIGERVACHVDADRRMQNTRTHSAGHLIDAAMKACGIGLEPTKGYHFPDSPYVEYADPPETRMTPEEREALLPQLQSALDELIAKDMPTEVLTNEDGIRTVTIGGLACPCGGTHVKTSSVIGQVTITGLKSKGSGKKKALRVSYRMGDM